MMNTWRRSALLSQQLPLLRRWESSTSSNMLAAVTCTAAAVSLVWSTRCDDNDDQHAGFRVEVHLMDKIQQKAYLQSAKDGIPSTLRLLAIDLPELRTQAFSGNCQLQHDQLFLDDLVPPKLVHLIKSDDTNTEEAKSSNNDHHPSKKQSKKEKEQQLKVAQKALVKSLVHCQSPQSQQRVGVELLEASVADLNPYQLRKTHQLGNFKYDPGKYYGSKQQRASEENKSAEPIAAGDATTTTTSSSSPEEDELEAPWNQYAWAEEMRLRINGQVDYTAPMERAPRWQRLIFGTVYRSTVAAQSRFWEWPLPQFAKSDPNGVDGRVHTHCRACNKPHAVLANGAALQRVPSSLRLLQKICKKADVPLYVIHDPRVWGGNTHQSLPEALKDMRAKIKNRVIGDALRQQGSAAFTRGRMLGQAETEAKWQVRESKRKAKRMLFGEEQRRRRNKSEETPKDWSQLDVALLEKKLAERGVIQRSKEGAEERTYSRAMVELARKCISSTGTVAEDEVSSTSKVASATSSSAPA